MTRLPALAVIACLVVFSAKPAMAWEAGVEYFEPVTCPWLRKRGAESLAIRVLPNAGSYGIPSVVGLREGKPIWRLTLPSAEAVNVAKLDVHCEGKSIVLRSAFPASTSAFHQQYIWNGKAFAKSKTWDTQD